ncbi:hypothetical protein FIBSPDRAFT_947817 [Athelia psychrophila]|uniref:F-box domain-containing protein n=2 Tax=Athelia psychrophila TaxID=1759441 RepID=A0A166RG26_9AGAM|nr:hypothetical protein FIBSPDRAFT_947817 [Fibularhizoctonia sp. CBS 109695]
MDRFSPLEPVRLYAPPPPPPSTTRSLFSSAKPQPAPAAPRTRSHTVLQPTIGRLPIDLHLLVLTFLPVPDLPAYARCSRATAGLARDDRVWALRWAALAVERCAFQPVLDTLEAQAQTQADSENRARAKAKEQDAADADDEFGEFAEAGAGSGAGFAQSLSFASPAHPRAQTKYQRAHALLTPLAASLAPTAPSVRAQAQTLHLLARFLSPQIQPLREWRAQRSLLRAATDRFLAHVLGALREHGARAVRVFPPRAGVLLAFAERLAGDVVAEYVTPLLTKAREVSNEAYLTAAAASFSMVWAMVDVLVEVGKVAPGSEPGDAAAATGEGQVGRERAEDVVYRMFEVNMDEYLDEEVESLKAAFDGIVKAWSKSTTPHTRFLASQNPALIKRTVLASFADILLLPVTIVPRTITSVGAALTTGGSAAVQGIAMLNPQRWGAGAGAGSAYARGTHDDDEDEEEEEVLEKAQEKGEGDVVFAIGDDDDDDEPGEKRASTTAAPKKKPAAAGTFELLLSLDVALELIHADRESLTRAATFAGYPGHYGHRVHDAIEEIFVLLLQALGARHVAPGFAQATAQMLEWKPAEHDGDAAEAGETGAAENGTGGEKGAGGPGGVAPLVQFFELVHIGDTIQSMVQVYFDKEMAPHIDRTDFLHPVVREKKRFEDALDDAVAAGLNAGTAVLMQQVEHVVITLTPPRAYYPPDDEPLELGPTRGCRAAIACLEVHCRLLKGSAGKEVLEVFYQEVGIRLIAILHKHIKRQIISLNGGFQVIADLNTYHAFIASLKVPQITSDFSHLKMLGHVYVVEDAKDLAQIVRDVTRYGGAYRPEDIYEFIQRRSDWKKIEKTVDKTMYNLSFKEDCVVC